MNRPPKRQFDRLFKQVQTLIQGQSIDFAANFARKKWHVLAWIAWLEDDYPTVDTIRVLKHPCTRKSLIKACFHSDDVDEERMHESQWDKINKSVTKHPKYKIIAQEIKDICVEANRWEKEYEDFDWNSDVLDKIV